MFKSLSPHKQLPSPKGEYTRPLGDTRRTRAGLSTSPRDLTSPQKQGKKIEDTKEVHIEIGHNEQFEAPRFPIRIPVETMKPKKNYLAQVRKSETTLDSRPSTAKQSKTDIHEKTGPRYTTEKPKAKTLKEIQALNKRYSLSRSEHTKSKGASSAENMTVDPKDLKKIIENIVDYKFKTYASGSTRALETQKSATNLSMDTSMKKRPNSSRRPMSSRASNKKKGNNYESNRASSKKEPREGDYSRMSHMIQQDPIETEEAKREQIQRAKTIVIENLKKFSNEQREKEEKEKQANNEKTLKKDQIREMNKRIRLKNEKSPAPIQQQRSPSPVKHKYGWGADQKKLEQKPERKDSTKKWEKKDPSVRRQEIGLSYLNNMEDLELKKAKIETKEKAVKIIKELEDKYNLKRKEKAPEEKEKLKSLINDQIEKKKKEKLEEKAKKKKENEEKKKKLEALFKNVAEIQAKDLAEKQLLEKDKPKKEVKKKPKKATRTEISSQPEEEEITTENFERGRGKQQQPQSQKKKQEEEKEEDEYGEEEFEEEIVDEPRGLSQDDLYLLDEIFEKLDINMERELVKAGFKKLKAYCFSEQMNKKVEQEKARLRQQQQQQQQKQQQQQQQQQLQQNAKGKTSVTNTAFVPKEKVESEKKTFHKQKSIDSEKKQKGSMPLDDYENDDYYEQQDAYVAKPLKESSNYSRALPPKSSMVEKGKQKSDTPNKRLEFREEEQMQENVGYRIYNVKSAEKAKNQTREAMYNENNRREEQIRKLEGADFDEMLFNLSSEELIKLPYFSILK